MSPYLIPHPETKIKEERKEKTQNKSRFWRVQSLKKKKKKKESNFTLKKSEEKVSTNFHLKLYKKNK